MSSLFIGLFIGWVSVVIFAIYVINSTSAKYKKENPERHESLKKELTRFELWVKSKKK